MRGLGLPVRCWVLGLFLAGGWAGAAWAQQPPQAPPPSGPSDGPASVQLFVSRHCVGCHNSDDQRGGLNLDAVRSEDVGAHPEVWEKVVRKLAGRQMPPGGRRRPDERTYEAVLSALEARLDRAAAARPNPGRTPTLRRLNRTEYQNAVRGLLAVDVDAAALLPADEANHGFDSAPLGGLSPTLLDRYLTAAQKISRLAVGRP